MSDVWQGPGWWLASDGKWYPADAEPGAVYEGDLPNEPTSVETAPSAAPEPTSAPPEPSAAYIAPEVDPTAVVDEAPVVEETPVVEASAPATASFGVDPFAQMPAPVVEEPKIGGWQSVAAEPAAPAQPVVDEPVSPIPVVPAVEAPDPTPAAPPAPAADEDGWTSAFEELQDGVDVNAPTVSESDIPAAQVPTEIPEVQIPEVQIPDAPAPQVQIPKVQIPDVPAPEVQVPTDIPDVPAPEVQVPTDIPDVPAPDVPGPEVAPPTVDVSTEIPEVAAPVASSAGSAPLIESPLTGAPDAGRPIERDDAWRKPLNADETAPRVAAATARPGVPDVVDLAIPDEPLPYMPETEGRNWGMIIGLVVSLAIICLIAFLIARFFTGDDDVTTTDPNGSITITEPDDTTAAPTTDSTDASAPSTESTDASTDTTEVDAGEDSGSVSVFALRAGDCIVGDIGAGQVTQVAKVDCEEEHQFEVYREALIESSITTFDEEAISAYAEEVCRTSLEAYIPPDDERGLKFKFLQPTEDSWNQAEDPDRVITCLLFDDDAPLIGRAN